MEVFLLTNNKALHNIPKLKLEYYIKDTLDKCNLCKNLEMDVNQSISGLCPSCSIIITVLYRYFNANIPIGYWNLSMKKDFVGDPNLLTKFNEVSSNLRKTFVDGTALCLAGKHGTGKTTFLSDLLKQACKKGYECFYTTLSDIVNAVTSAPFEEKYEAGRTLNKTQFLVIDEFDPRFFSSSENAADLYARSLENIFRTRAQNKLPTFLSTNSPNVLQSFNGALKESINSLFRGHLETVIVLGEDQRGKITNE
jgi:DNA replication protein DnaC